MHGWKDSTLLLNQSLSHGLLAVRLVSNGRLCSTCQQSFPQGGVDVITKKAYFMLCCCSVTGNIPPSSFASERNHLAFLVSDSDVK